MLDCLPFVCCLSLTIFYEGNMKRRGETWRGEVEVMLRGAHGLDGVRVRESEGGD